MAERISVQVTGAGLGNPEVTVETHGPRISLDTLRIGRAGILWTKRQTKRKRAVPWAEMDRLWGFIIHKPYQMSPSARAEKMQITVVDVHRSMPVTTVKTFYNASVVGTLKMDETYIWWIPYNHATGNRCKWTEFDNLVSEHKKNKGRTRKLH
jgi:hypothetical protein